MFQLFRMIWKIGNVTKKDPFPPAPQFKGKPILTSDICTGCQECVHVCPSGAIQLFPTSWDAQELSLNYSCCVFCGMCSEVCETNLIQTTSDYRLATKQKLDLIHKVIIPSKSGPIEAHKGDESNEGKTENKLGTNLT